MDGPPSVLSVLQPRAGIPRRASPPAVAGAGSSVRWIPPGDQGTYITLREMARLVREGANVPAVREQAGALVGRCPPSPSCHAQTIRAWLTNIWRFVRDPRGIELVHRPERLLREFESHGYASGDCDDVAVLGGALGKAVGLVPRFVVLGFHGGNGPFTHVYAELKANGKWVDLDVTKSWNPPAVRRRRLWSI